MIHLAWSSAGRAAGSSETLRRSRCISSSTRARRSSMGSGALSDSTRPGDDIAASDQIMADILEPVPQLECGNAIFTVVGLNGLANVLRWISNIIQLQSAFELPQASPRIHQRRHTFEAVEDLEFLERIRLDARAHGLLDHPVQINKHAGTEQLIHLVFAAGIASHQAL